MNFQEFNKLPEATKVRVGEIADNLRTAFQTGGLDKEGNLISIKDALDTPDSHLAVQRVVTEIIQEAREPNLIGHLLIDQMFTTDQGQDQVTIRTLGSLGGINFEVAEEGEYPEIGLNRGQQNTLQAQYGKYGAKIKISEEMVKASQWNLIDQWIRKVVAALARYKEAKIFNMFNELGNTVYDNLNPNAASVAIGRTTGRDIYGQGNGSITVSDLIDMYGYLMSKGYIPNVIIVHPMHWAMFAKDPIIREAGLARGDINQWVNSQVSPINPYKYIAGWNNTLRGANGNRQEVTNEERNLLERTPPTIPAYSGPLAGLTVLVSEFVPYDEGAKTASIFMVDTRNTGVLITNETLTLQDWDEPVNDIKVFKLREKYALAMYDKGEAVAVARNISLEPNEIFNSPQIVIDNLPVINHKD